MVNGGDWGRIVHCARIKFQPQKVTPHIHSDEVTVQRLCYPNSSALGWHNGHQSGVVSRTNKLIVQNGKKFRGVQKEQQRTQNTALRHSWQNVDQFTATSIHQNILWSIRYELRQYIQHRTSDTHKAELIEYKLMTYSSYQRDCMVVWLFDGWPYQKQRWSLSAQSWPPARSPMHSAVYVIHTKAHHRYPNPRLWIDNLILIGYFY